MDILSVVDAIANAIQWVFTFLSNIINFFVSAFSFIGQLGDTIQSLTSYVPTEILFIPTICITIAIVRFIVKLGDPE